MNIVKEVESLKKKVNILESDIKSHQNAIKWLKGQIKGLKKDAVQGKEEKEV